MLSTKQNPQLDLSIISKVFKNKMYDSGYFIPVKVGKGIQLVLIDSFKEYLYYLEYGSQEGFIK